MSCNFCKHIKKQGMSQYCPKVGNKEIIYDQSTDCPHYIARDDAPDWAKKTRNNDMIAARKEGQMSEQWHYEQKGGSYIKVDTLHKIRTLESELAAVIEQRDGLRSGIDYASDQLTRVTEQRDRLAEALRGAVSLAVNEPEFLIGYFLSEDAPVREALQSLNQH